MLRYIAKRLAYIFLAVLVISAITFALLQLAPGNYLETQRLLDSYYDVPRSGSLSAVGWKAGRNN